MKRAAFLLRQWPMCLQMKDFTRNPVNGHHKMTPDAGNVSNGLRCRWLTQLRWIFPS
jgi:hypothetical protein